MASHSSALRRLKALENDWPAPNVGDASREQELSFNMIGSRIALGGVVKTKADAEHVIATMQALKVLLKDSDEKAPASPSAPSPPSEQ